LPKYITTGDRAIDAIVPRMEAGAEVREMQAGITVDTVGV
jgi:hypothetical protein